MLLLKLGWRNVWRHRVRTLLSVVGIAGGMGSLVFTRALMANTEREMAHLTATTVTGDVQVQRMGYRAQPSLARSFRLEAPLLARLRSVPGVVEVAARAEGEALLTLGARSAVGTLQGLSFEADPVVPALRAALRSGAWPSTEDSSSAVLGTGLARRLRAQVGSEIVLTTQGFDGSTGAALLRVAGIFECGRSEADGRWLVVSQEAASRLLSLDGRATQIVVTTEAIERSGDVAEGLRAALRDGQLTALDWSELSPMTKDLIELDAAQGTLFLAVLLIVVGFGTLNSILMATTERLREFGVLRAIGMSPAATAGLVVTETAIVAALGALLGGAVSLGLCAYFSRHGISIGSADGWQAMGYMSEFRTRLSATNLATSAITMAAVAMLAAAYPALTAARIRPNDALSRL